jgi:uncharacterized membrane protein (UPF0127 family)
MPFPLATPTHLPLSLVHRSAFLILLATTACHATQADPAAPPIHFDTVSVTIKGTVFTVEVADTDAKRERGLMFRESMPDDHGMIFLFDVADKYPFWMKNTDIPLDIVYLDENRKVVDFHTMKPHDETPTPPDSPALYAIELNGGMVKKLKIAKGDIVALPEKLLKHSAHSDEK